MDKVPTDIPGFDEIINGGIPSNQVVLVTGSPGTGKTIFCTQFLINGVKKGEFGLYVTLEENKEMMYRQAKQFGWDLKKMEAENKLKIISPQTQDLEELLNTIRQEITAMDAKRFVLDSLPMLSMYTKRYSRFKKIIQEKEQTASSEGDIQLPPLGKELSRSDLIFILKTIKDFGTTSLLITEMDEESGHLSTDTVSEFLCDGIIVFYHVAIGGMEDFTMQVRKMRCCKISLKGIIPFDINDKGIFVKSDEARTTLGI